MVKTQDVNVELHNISRSIGDGDATSTTLELVCLVLNPLLWSMLVSIVVSVDGL